MFVVHIEQGYHYAHRNLSRTLCGQPLTPHTMAIDAQRASYLVQCPACLALAEAKEVNDGKSGSN